MDATASAPRPPAVRALSRRTILAALAGAVLLLGAAPPAGMAIVHRIDDDLAFDAGATDLPPGSSRAVAAIAALVHRETDVNRWVANDPWFMPGHWLDNMPNFQQGMFAALARATAELRDRLGRTRGTSQEDPDLREAAGLLQFPGDKWIVDLATSPWPQATSEAQYRRARKALLAYNARLAAGGAAFERRADNLLETLDRIALDLGASAAGLDRRIAEHGGRPFDPGADDIFYTIKGQAYGYAMVLRGLGRDFETLLRDRGVAPLWNQMLESLGHAARMDPLVVMNAAPDGVLFPSHLAGQGFYVLRARAQLREITNVLAK
jgi:hypothetical protein